MNQKGFTNIALVIIVVALVVVGAYFVSTRQITPPTPSPASSSTPSPTPRPTVTPTPKPSPTPTPTTTSDDPYGWPIQSVCIPVTRSGDPVVTRDLHDGTYVYQRSDGTLFRGDQNKCRCLSGQTLISTPDGLKMVKSLKTGMYVFTLDRKGNKVIAPLIKVAKVSVPNNYLISHLLLDDNRELFASNAHPTADGRTIRELSSGDTFDGARVVKRELVSFSDLFTYDILPAGDTGFYFANDILLGSTISK